MNVTKLSCWCGVLALAGSLGAQPTAVIQGKVEFKGDPPKARPINFGAEKICADLNKNKQPMFEDVLVNKNHTVKWAFVYVKEGLNGSFPVPEETVVVDQIDCVFIPRVTGVMVGQNVEFRNSDPVLHNVRSESKKGQSFNLVQPLKGMKSTRKFKTEEVGIPIKCDVHFWMLGFVHALPHPFFAVTGDDGAFAIKGLPPGNYTLAVWHEKLGVKSQPVSVSAGQTVTADFTLEGK